MGEQKVVLSSSGNAGISAAMYARTAGVKLKVFVSPKVDVSKLRELESVGVSVVRTLRPVSSAYRFSK